ncbi:uncharacterized protein METZ01_LOCUS331900, partial [marine metagenome]
MDNDELSSVLKRNKLKNDILWTLPILLQVDKNIVKTLPKKGQVLLKRKNDENPFALLEIKKIEKIKDIKKTAVLWFGTSDLKHPGVNKFLSR